MIESGGNIEKMKGQKLKTDKSDKKKNQQDSTNKGNEDLSEDVGTTLAEESSGANKKQRKVAQFSFLGYSLGGLIGRFAMAMLDVEGFFTPTEEGGRGIEPMYFVTMATPHLGIRQPSRSRFTKVFNFLSARMLSRTGMFFTPEECDVDYLEMQRIANSVPLLICCCTRNVGEQLQLVDNYMDGKPILLVMSEPTSIFVDILTKFKRRVVYSNVRNDRSVPFWTASFSDADPFRELDAMDM